MPDDKLGNAQRAALLALMGAGREVTNTELLGRGIRLTRPDRDELNDRGFIVSVRDKGNQPYRHSLTEAGWDRCGEELTAEPPPRPGALGGALYYVLEGVARHQNRSGLRTDEVFEADELAIDQRVRAIYEKLATGPRAWVALAALRGALAESRDEVDQALHRLNRAPDVNIIPESNQKVLTQSDHDAAIRIGGEARHLIAIGSR